MHEMSSRCGRGAEFNYVAHVSNVPVGNIHYVRTKHLLFIVF